MGRRKALAVEHLVQTCNKSYNLQFNAPSSFGNLKAEKIETNLKLAKISSCIIQTKIGKIDIGQDPKGLCRAPDL